MQRKTHYGEELESRTSEGPARQSVRSPKRAFQEKAGLVTQRDWISLK